MSICPNGGSSLFGPSSQYIKTYGGDFIAIEGSNTRERQVLSDLRMPYKQILKGRILLKIGQVNYFLNHLGLGDNATFLSIKATYDPKSVIEEDNYVTWSYADDLTRINYFAQLMTLTGNSTYRIPQLYLTNPSTKYQVQLDVMVAVIDDTYSFFTDTLNQTGTSFTGLEYTDIESYVVGQSIVIYDKSSTPSPLIYITINDINAVERTGTVVIVDDSAYGTIFLQFLTEFDAAQAQSLLSYVMANPSVDINNLSPVSDTVDPVLYFNSTIAGSASGDYIAFNGATAGVPYDTSDGFTFSSSVSITSFGTASGTYIDKPQLVYLLIDHITDNRDGSMTLMDSNMIITGTGGVVSTIANVGTYELTFDFSDIAQNYLDGVIVSLDITT